MTDQWAAWLLYKRFGGDPAALNKISPQLQQFRDKVLDGAKINPHDTVLDVGCGDGLLAVSALDRAATVIFSDISQQLLDRCQQIVSDLNAQERSQFVQTGLPDLVELPDNSVDVAMTRSVLIYIADKARSFRAMHRVLRPGGRLSIFEPINRFGWPEANHVLWGCDVRGLEQLAGKVTEAYRRHQHEPMVDFDERDLVGLAEAAGFGEVRLEYYAHIGRSEETVSWPTFLKTAANPLVPTFGEILAEALQGDDYTTLATRLEAQLPSRQSRRAGAYLTATR